LREATSLTAYQGQAIYKYTFNFSPSVTLAAATTYISVLNNTSNATAWYWQGIVPKTGPRWNKFASGTSWSAAADSLAFELSDAPILPFTVGGDVSGLASGASIVLQNNGADDQTLSVDGSFTFTQQSDGSSYDVTVATQPPGQTCAVTSGTGTLAGADVSGVSVSCADNSYTIGGQITGLISGDPVVLQNNGGDNLTLTSDGAFTFSAPIPYTTAYSVTVLTQPSAPSETCTVTNGAGKVPNSNVNNVAVVCALNSFTVGGSVSGLTPGGSIELQNNGADSQTLMSDGAFTFTAQADGSTYSVTVSSQPEGQMCSVTSGGGTLAGLPVTNVAVSCVNNQYTVGGLLSGLVAGDTVVLQNNNGDDLRLTADGAFTFATKLGFQDAYAVTILSQSGGLSETCTLSNGSGTMGASSVDNVSIICALDSFTVGGSVSGLATGESVVLQNNGVDSQTQSTDGNFVFSQQADGASYSVAVSTQPVGQTCIVADGSGTLSGADVSSVSVSCVDTPAPRTSTDRSNARPNQPTVATGHHGRTVISSGYQEAAQSLSLLEPA